MHFLLFVPFKSLYKQSRAMSKQFVTLNEAIGFLNYINSNNEAFKGTQYKHVEPNAQLQPYLQNLTSIYKLATKAAPRKKELRLEEENELEGQSHHRKILNKNRAIKRIIDEAKHILQAKHKYEEPLINDKKSYVTQFNIYLKQYNRLSEQLISQDEQARERERELIENEEAKLEKVYAYTVCQDFREMLQVSIVRDKINKNNVDMMMETFKECLVVLKVNQIRIYDSEEEQNLIREVKLYQVENVDYFTQPYIFIAVSIVKDKSLPNQYLYIRFDCLETQNKWDRALYCNYITRTMKRKNKYFLYQFPEKEDEKEVKEGRDHIIHKRDDFLKYEIDRKKIVKNLLTNMERQHSRMASIGMDTQREMPMTTDRKQRIQRHNTDHNGRSASPSKQSLNHMGTSKNLESNKSFLESVAKSGTQPENNGENGAKNVPKEQQGEAKNPLVNIFGAKLFNVFEQKVNAASNEPVPDIEKVESEQLVEQSQKKDEQALNVIVKRKIELREKHKNGIVVKKPKFFSEKTKIVYLSNAELEYWDYDPGTKRKQQKKLIIIKQLKNYTIKQKNSMISFELPTKTLQFVGKLQELKEIAEWMQIPKMEKQVEARIIEKAKQRDNTKQQPLILAPN